MEYDLMLDSIEEIGNQQRSFELEKRLCWLGGLIDGEGCFTLTARREAKDNISYRPRIHITNTDETIINEVTSIFDLVHIPYLVTKSNARTLEHKDRFDVVISGFKRCRRALPELIPYLVGKKSRAELMFEFCHYRLSQPKCSRHSQYTERDIFYVRLLRSANGTGQISKSLRDYTPEAVVNTGVI